MSSNLQIVEPRIPGYISKSELYEKLAAAGHRPTDDQIDRFRTAGIIDGLSALPGRGAERFATQEIVQRLFVIYGTIKLLGLKKPRPSELAFWLAYEGFYVPKKLIAEHLAWSIRGFISRLYRELGRRTVVALTHLSPTAADTLASKINVTVLAFARIEQGSISGPLMQMLVRGSLGVFLRKESYAAVSLPFRRSLEALVGEPAASEGSRLLWEVFAEISLFVTNSRSNPLTAAVTRYQGDHTLSGDICADSRLLIASASEVFPWLTQPHLAASESFPLNDEDCQLVLRFLPPIITAMLLTLRENPHTQNLIGNLRTGQTKSARIELLQMRELVANLRTYPRDSVNE